MLAVVTLKLICAEDFSFFPPQTIKNKELSSGYKIIQKPYPEKSLKMCERFILTADMERAEIYPEVWFELAFSY